MQTIPLEDSSSDIIGKALRGLKITVARVADQAGVEVAAVQALCDGEWNADTARKIAPVLGLGTEALLKAGAKSWSPRQVSLDGVAQFNTPFEDMTVNSYLLWDAATGEAAAFDTGADCTGMLEFLAGKQLRLVRIFLTHTHGDHVLELDRLKEKTGAPAVVGAGEPLEGAESFPPGTSFVVGSLQIETRLTWGHSKGGITYVVAGLAQPVAVVGDAVFAGSMGGGMISYEAALATNRKEIFSLSDDTVLCPGHGPLTTVGEQRTANPFFATA